MIDFKVEDHLRDKEIIKWNLARVAVDGKDIKQAAWGAKLQRTLFDLARCRAVIFDTKVLIELLPSTPIYNKILERLAACLAGVGKESESSDG